MNYNNFSYKREVIIIYNEKILRRRFKVFKSLINFGYNTDDKIKSLNIIDLIDSNFCKSDLVLALDIKDALINGTLVTFLCGLEKKERKDDMNKIYKNEIIIEGILINKDLNNKFFEIKTNGNDFELIFDDNFNVDLLNKINEGSKVRVKGMLTQSDKELVFLAREIILLRGEK